MGTGYSAQRRGDCRRKRELGSRTVYPLSLDVPLPFVCAMLISLSGS
jgi:hypothetical protein